MKRQGLLDKLIEDIVDWLLQWGATKRSFAFYAASVAFAAFAYICYLFYPGRPWLFVRFYGGTLFSLVLTLGVEFAQYRNRIISQFTRNVESLRLLGWQAFERFMVEIFRLEGFEVDLVGQAGPDGGVDLVLKKEGVTTIVQCKQYRNEQVAVSFVRDLYGVMHHEKADRGILVTTGVFSFPCEEFAKGKPIELIDGGALFERMQKVRPYFKPIKVSDEDTGVTEMTKAIINKITPAGPTMQWPQCPKCGIDMKIKINSVDGKPFWGCPNWQRESNRCEQTQNLSSALQKFIQEYDNCLQRRSRQQAK